MEYLADIDTLKMSISEFNTLRLRLKLTPNSLSMIPLLNSEVNDAIIDMQAFTSLESDKQAVFLDLIRTFCVPESTILWNETVSDLTQSQNAAAWVSVMPDRWAIMTMVGNDIWLRSRLASELCQSFSHFMAVYPGLQRKNFQLAMTTNASLTTLAALDQSLLMHLQSKLAHTRPVLAFSKKEIISRFAEAKIEDFRWPLLFLEKLIPVDLETCSQNKTLDLSLDELCKAGLLTSVPADMNQSDADLYLFTNEGDVLREGFLHETAKIGMRVRKASETNEVTDEVLMFLRDPFSLWLMDLTGSEAAILDVGQEEFKNIIGSIFHYN